MIIKMKVPSPGESITEVQIARWIKKDGDYVEKDEDVCEIDSDKATLTLPAEESGKLKIVAKEGETIAVGSVVCTIDTEAKQNAKPAALKTEEKIKTEEQPPTPKKEAAPVNSKREIPAVKQEAGYATGTPSVAAEKIMREKKIKAEEVTATGKGGRITKGDVMEQQTNGAPKTKAPAPVSGSRNEWREKMSMLRRRVAERLVAVKQQTAMLTTFNEVDMSAVMNMRKQYKDKFKETFGVGLGFMSFFTKAVCVALKNFQEVNAEIAGDEIVYHDYCDIGIAVSAPKGLMVPIIRNAETLSFAQIEQQVLDLATKAREGKISIEEMTGGTFTITNGGLFGSMLSTPIINPPQSAILGMHNIVDRPVAINGKVEIRPIMYIALSYDHRIIDGREAVSFLVNIKQMLEEPAKMLLEGKDAAKVLLGL